MVKCNRYMVRAKSMCKYNDCFITVYPLSFFEWIDSVFISSIQLINKIYIMYRVPVESNVSPRDHIKF